MDNILFVCEKGNRSKYNEYMEKLEYKLFFTDIDKIYEALSSNDFILIIIDYSKYDSLNITTLNNISKTKQIPMVVLSESDIDELNINDIIIMNSSMFVNMLPHIQKIISIYKKCINELRLENMKVNMKLNDLKNINRAKCILIEKLNFTEPQAHRYLEKKAMDNRISKNQVATKILEKHGCI